MKNDQKTGNSINPQIRDLLSPYLDGEVTADERTRVESALLKSPELRAELNSLRHTVQMMQSLPRIPAPRPFTLSAADVGLGEPKSRGIFGWLKPALLGVSGVAALVAVVFVGMTIFRQAGFGGQNNQIALAPQAEMMQSATAPAEPPQAMTFSAAETAPEAEVTESQIDSAAESGAPMQKAAVPTPMTLSTELPATPAESPAPMAAAAEPEAGMAADVAACEILPQNAFADVWLANPDLQTALGCPAEPHPRIEPDAYTVKTAFQPFEHGTMIWSDRVAWYPQPIIYVLFEDGTYRRFDDAFNPETDTVAGDELPPDGKFAPQLGFGKIWRTEPGIRDALGWATAPEQPGDGTFQMFEHGEMLKLPQTGKIYAFLRDTSQVKIFDTP